MAEDDQFLWVSSAMRRGLRDRSEGGIIYCPEVSARQELESRWQYEENLESDNHQSKHGRQTHWLKNIAQPHKNDVLIGRGRISNDRPGNHYWRKLMKEIKSDYDTRMTGKKSILVRLVVEAVKKQSPPGRFLAQDKGTGLWIEIGDEVAMKKTAQGLRDLGKVRKTAVKVKREGKNKMNKMKYQVVGALVNTDLNTPATKTFAGENDEQCDVVNMLDENVAELIDNERINLHAPKRTKAEHKATANSANTIDMHCYRPQAKLKSKCAATSTSSLEKNAKPDWRVLEESLSDVFHDSSLKKSVRTPGALSGYFGVTKTRGGKYEARFAGYRIGSYVLRADAALAYDGAVRASRLKKRNCKLNFGAEQDYMAARDNELKERHLAVDLWETIEFITSKVNQAVSKNREKFMF